mmetsp:Transcript_92491/g.239457  ORF Transcript_92491/g.239457 Transcript_92491/m.239457 type:complete len:207 (-) Transcript_92491:224-844(-)
MAGICSTTGRLRLMRIACSCPAASASTSGACGRRRTQPCISRTMARARWGMGASWERLRSSPRKPWRCISIMLTIAPSTSVPTQARTASSRGAWTRSVPASCWTRRCSSQTSTPRSAPSPRTRPSIRSSMRRIGSAVGTCPSTTSAPARRTTAWALWTRHSPPWRAAAELFLARIESMSSNLRHAILCCVPVRKVLFSCCLCCGTP